MSTIHHPWQKKVLSYRRDRRITAQAGAHPGTKALARDKRYRTHQERHRLRDALHAWDGRGDPWEAQEAALEAVAQTRHAPRLSRPTYQRLWDWLHQRPVKPGV